MCRGTRVRVRARVMVRVRDRVRVRIRVKVRDVRRRELLKVQYGHGTSAD